MNSKSQLITHLLVPILFTRNNSLISYFLQSSAPGVDQRILLETDENICRERTEHIYPKWAQNTKSKNKCSTKISNIYLSRKAYVYCQP